MGKRSVAFITASTIALLGLGSFYRYKREENSELRQYVVQAKHFSALPETSETLHRIETLYSLEEKWRLLSTLESDLVELREFTSKTGVLCRNAQTTEDINELEKQLSREWLVAGIPQGKCERLRTYVFPPEHKEIPDILWKTIQPQDADKYACTTTEDIVDILRVLGAPRKQLTERGTFMFAFPPDLAERIGKHATAAQTLLTTLHSTGIYTVNQDVSDHNALVFAATLAYVDTGIAITERKYPFTAKISKIVFENTVLQQATRYYENPEACTPEARASAYLLACRQLAPSDPAAQFCILARTTTSSRKKIHNEQESALQQYNKYKNDITTTTILDAVATEVQKISLYKNLLRQIEERLKR